MPTPISAERRKPIGSIETLRERVSSCQACPLGRGRVAAVPGYGKIPSRVMAIAEAPGWHEENARPPRPMIGPAGQLFDEMLERVGLQRSEIYVTNVVKSRPPNNRDPRPSEIKACRQWLDLELELVRPEIILALGRYASLTFCPTEKPADIRGCALRLGDYVCFFALHPAAVLHNPSLESYLEQQLRQFATLL